MIPLMEFIFPRGIYRRKFRVLKANVRVINRYCYAQASDCSLAEADVCDFLSLKAMILSYDTVRVSEQCSAHTALAIREGLNTRHGCWLMDY
jgi:hypothetical protein